MGEKVEVVVEETQDEAERKPFLQTTRKVLLAAIGAMALAQEELEAFVNKLVERGEIAEHDGKKLVGEMMEKRKKETKRAEDEMDNRISDLMDRMNVPTKSDIDALSAKITALTKKVDELKKS
jgi:poly(hydroxyalkanoate) granule-associated protein